MLKIFVCEDNIVQRKKMESIIDCLKADMVDVIEKGIVTANPYEILEHIRNENNSCLYFLDIDLKCDMDGFMLAHKIRETQPRCCIVFVTTHSEMSFMTFPYRIEAMDFIIKDDIGKLEERMLQCIEQAIERCCRKEEKDTEKYTVKIGNHIKNITLSEIKYFEAVAETRKIILHATNCVIEFSGKLKEIEKNLNEDFVRCHRSVIVNTKYIESVDRINHIIYLKDGEICHMSVRLGKKIW